MRFNKNGTFVLLTKYIQASVIKTFRGFFLGAASLLSFLFVNRFQIQLVRGKKITLNALVPYTCIPLITSHVLKNSPSNFLSTI